MTDERCRQLERRWQATGSVEDEAGLLSHRLRSHDLDEERIELAAYLMHPAARLLLGSHALDPPTDVKRLGRGIAGWGTEAGSRAVLACALAIWRPVQRGPPAVRFEPRLTAALCALLRAAALWVHNPGNAVPGRVGEAENEARAVTWEFHDGHRQAEVGRRYKHRPLLNMRERRLLLLKDVLHDGVRVMHSSCRGAGELSSLADRVERAIESARRSSLSGAQVTRELREHLIPWALGYADPLERAAIQLAGWPTH